MITLLIWKRACIWSAITGIICIYSFIPWAKGINRCSKCKAYLWCTVSPSYKATIIAMKKCPDKRGGLY
jgi:hypothetical protein